MLHLLILLIAVATAQGQELPADQNPDIPAVDIIKACEVVLVSESELGASSPNTLDKLAIQAKWAYQQSNHGVIRSNYLPADSGHVDVWIQKDELETNGLIHDVKAIFYVTTEESGDGGLQGTLAIRAQGDYVPSRGILCMLGCPDALYPMETPAISPLNSSLAAGQEVPSPYGSEGSEGSEATNLDAEAEAEAEQEVGEVEAGVAHTTPVSKVLETECRVRIVLRFAPLEDESKKDKVQVSGQIESLRTPGEPKFFSPILLTGSTGDINTQLAWFDLEMVVEAALYLLQAAFIGWQINHSRRDPAAAWLSQTMIGAQIFVYLAYWLQSLYYPLRYMSAEILYYFVSDLANLPRFAEFVISCLYISLGVLVDFKRRKAAKLRAAAAAAVVSGAAAALDESLEANGYDVESSSLLTSPPPQAAGPASVGGGSRLVWGPGTSERQLAAVFWPAYAFLALVLWFSFELDNFLRLSTFLFLLPQLTANALWDPPPAAVRAVTWVFVAGNSAVNMVWLTYEVVRPRLMGYDAFFAFPHAWYWTSMLFMALQLAAFAHQRRTVRRKGAGDTPQNAAVAMGAELSNLSGM